MGLVAISFVALPALVTSCEDPETKVPQYTGVTLGGSIMIYAEVGTDFETAKKLATDVILDRFDSWDKGSQNDFLDKVDVIYIDNNVDTYNYYDTENSEKTLRLSPTNLTDVNIKTIMAMIMNGNIEIQ